jgi:hypothetical protein
MASAAPGELTSVTRESRRNAARIWAVVIACACGSKIFRVVGAT